MSIPSIYHTVSSFTMTVVGYKKSWVVAYRIISYRSVRRPISSSILEIGSISIEHAEQEHDTPSNTRQCNCLCTTKKKTTTMKLRMKIKINNMFRLDNKRKLAQNMARKLLTKMKQSLRACSQRPKGTRKLPDRLTTASYDVGVRTWRVVVHKYITCVCTLWSWSKPTGLL